MITRYNTNNGAERNYIITFHYDRSSTIINYYYHQSKLLFDQNFDHTETTETY